MTSKQPTSANRQHGFIARLVSWIKGEITSIEATAVREFHDVVTNLTFSDVEAIGATILPLVANIYLNKIMMEGPVDPEEATGRLQSFMSSAAGQGIMMGAANIAGSIPSVGQVNNLGQGIEGVVNNLGMGYMNYQMMGPMMTQTLGNPLEAKFRESAQSNTLDEEQVQTAYQKGLMSDAEADQQLSELGYRGELSTAVRQSALAPIDTATVTQLFTEGSLSEEEAASQLRRNGMAPQDVNTLIGAIKSKPLVNGTAQITESLTKLLQQDAITEQEFKDLMRSLGQDEDKIAAVVTSANSVKQTQLIADEFTRLTDLYRQGTLTQDQVVNQLKDLGLSEEAITNKLNQINISVKQSNSNEEIIKLDSLLSQGVITEDKYLESMQKLGLSQEQATNNLNKTLAKLTEQNKGQTPNRTPAQTSINIAYAEGYLTKEEFTLMSDQIGTPQSQIDQILASVTVQPRLGTQNIPLNYIGEAIGYSILDQEQALQLLNGAGYSTTMSNILYEVLQRDYAYLSKQETSGTPSTSSQPNILGGTNLALLDPSEFIPAFSAMDITEDKSVQILALVYNHLIRAGFISDVYAQKMFETIGISQTEAQVLLGG